MLQDAYETLTDSGEKSKYDLYLKKKDRVQRQRVKRFVFQTLEVTLLSVVRYLSSVGFRLCSTPDFRRTPSVPLVPLVQGFTEGARGRMKLAWSFGGLNLIGTKTRSAILVLLSYTTVAVLLFM